MKWYVSMPLASVTILVSTYAMRWREFAGMVAIGISLGIWETIGYWKAQKELDVSHDGI
jgi:hypothetical protein